MVNLVYSIVMPSTYKLNRQYFTVANSVILKFNLKSSTRCAGTPDNGKSNNIRGNLSMSKIQLSTNKSGSYELDKLDNKNSMESRIKNAENWVSKKLSDADAEFINKALGIDMDIMNDNLGNKKQKRIKMLKFPSGSHDQRKLSAAANQDLTFDARIRGFLELNPRICSGCGASFQTKSPDNPGISF